MDSSGIAFGLGFCSTGQTNRNDTASSEVDALMQNYLQQCLDYHEKQSEQEDPPSAPTFISATSQEIPLVDKTPAKVETTVRKAADEAVAKARAIVQKFQLQLAVPKEHSEMTPSHYRQRRELHYQKERERLRKATLKNFEYVARREEERLHLQLQQIQQTREAESHLKQRHDEILKQRQAIQKQSLAGIGTSRRQGLERTKQKSMVQPKNDTVAIYLSGLPADGAMTERDVKQLFSSYGTIRRVIFYRDKQTGQLKGDGLVVFELSSSNNAQRKGLLDSVCSQMNGAQLPSGTVLQVEPADSGYRTRASETDCNTSHYGPSNKRVEQAINVLTAKQQIEPEEADEKKMQEATADLDDFFASL